VCCFWRGGLTIEANNKTVIHPAETHPDVILHAIASRDINVAKRAAQSYHFKNAYGSYQELLDDPDIDIVYISTPNGMHYEWASKSLKAGKHVLCEKPFTSNAEEARKLVELAKEKNLVCEEAVRFVRNVPCSLSLMFLSSSTGNFTLQHIVFERFSIRVNMAASCELVRS
jgi:Oxidoreductase family, NAD-binding Rossmann fold